MTAFASRKAGQASVAEAAAISSSVPSIPGASLHTLSSCHVPLSSQRLHSICFCGRDPHRYHHLVTTSRLHHGDWSRQLIAHVEGGLACLLAA